MKLTDRVSTSDSVVSREVSGETVLLDLDKGIYFGLNAVGGRIWSLIEEKPRTLAEICAVLQAEFAVTEEEAARDLLQLTGELAEQGLLAKAA